MNPNTGEVRQFTSKEEARRQGFTVPVMSALLAIGGVLPAIKAPRKEKYPGQHTAYLVGSNNAARKEPSGHAR